MQVRTPDFFFQHFLNERKCYFCHLSLRHELHCHNHYNKYHSGLKKQYYIWSGALRRWVKVDFFQFASAQAHKVPVAIARVKS